LKICKVCKIEKPFSEYIYRKDSDSYRNECKCCKKEIDRLYKLKHKDKLQSKFKDKYHKNREMYLEKAKEFYKHNKDHIKTRSLTYYKNNKEIISQKRKQYQKTRLQTDNIFKVTRNLRNRLWYALKNKTWDKSSGFSDYIGLSDYSELKLFIENQFTNEMNWENYGKIWDIDHVIPLSLARTEKDLYKLCHYTNLQPKLSKSNRTEKRNRFNFSEELKVTLIDYNQGQEFLIKNHYLHRKAPSEYTFGLFQNNGTLVGVCTFHTPFSPGLKRMICGPQYKDFVIELNRLSVIDILPKNTESWFISQCINSGEIKKSIIVTFADTEKQHSGTIYQATNFIYTGLTDSKKEFSLKNSNKHSTSLALKYSVKELKEKFKEEFTYVSRSRKHRYVKFIGNKRQVKELQKQFKLPILSYPK